MKKRGLIILVLIILFTQSLVHSSKIDDNGIKFSIKAAEDFERYYEETNSNYKIERGGQFLLYLEIENTNDGEFLLENTYLRYEIFVDHKLLSSMKLPDPIFLGRKGNDLAIRRFPITGKAFEYFPSSGGKVNAIYENSFYNIISERPKEPIKIDFSVKNKYNSDWVKIGAYNFELVSSEQMKGLKDEKTTASSKEDWTLVLVALSVILIWFSTTGRAGGNTAKWGIRIVAFIMFLIAVFVYRM